VNTTRGKAQPSRRGIPVTPVTTAKNPIQGFSRKLSQGQAQLRRQRALATTRTRSLSLWEDGYTRKPVANLPGSFDVVKSDGTTYRVVIFFDTQECRWAYTCNCCMFAGQAKSGHVHQPECKHGDRCISDFLQLLDQIGKILPDVKADIEKQFRADIVAAPINAPIAITDTPRTQASDNSFNSFAVSNEDAPEEERQSGLLWRHTLPTPPPATFLQNGDGNARRRGFSSGFDSQADFEASRNQDFD
jgi:hypothetical protein